MEQHELHPGKNDSVPSQSKSISKDAERKRKSRSKLTEDDKINEREKAKKRMRTIRLFKFMNCFRYCPCWKESFNRSHSIHER